MLHIKDNIEEWVQSFQRGEKKGFTYFFNAFYPALFFYAYRIIGDKPAAAEIVQDCFVHIWEHHASLGEYDEIKSSFYNAVYEECRDWQSGQEGGIQPDNFSSQAIYELIRTEVTREIHSVINEMPEHYRDVFKSLFINGKSLHEVSAEMNLSVHTLQNHQLMGLTFLRRKLPNLFAI